MLAFSAFGLRINKGALLCCGMICTSLCSNMLLAAPFFVKHKMGYPGYPIKEDRSLPRYRSLQNISVHLEKNEALRLEDGNGSFLSILGPADFDILENGSLSLESGFSHLRVLDSSELRLPSYCDLKITDLPFELFLESFPDKKTCRFRIIEGALSNSSFTLKSDSLWQLSGKEWSEYKVSEVDLKNQRDLHSWHLMNLPTETNDTEQRHLGSTLALLVFGGASRFLPSENTIYRQQTLAIGTALQVGREFSLRTNKNVQFLEPRVYGRLALEVGLSSHELIKNNDASSKTKFLLLDYGPQFALGWQGLELAATLFGVQVLNGSISTARSWGYRYELGYTNFSLGKNSWFHMGLFIDDALLKVSTQTTNITKKTYGIRSGIRY